MYVRDSNQRSWLLNYALHEYLILCGWKLQYPNRKGSSQLYKSHVFLNNKNYFKTLFLLYFQTPFKPRMSN